LRARGKHATQGSCDERGEPGTGVQETLSAADGIDVFAQHNRIPLLGQFLWLTSNTPQTLLMFSEIGHAINAGSCSQRELRILPE
jgi:hypothetical protein